jgi:hypothetical protein
MDCRAQFFSARELMFGSRAGAELQNSAVIWLALSWFVLGAAFLHVVA